MNNMPAQVHRSWSIDLATKRFMVQSKRFFLDVKQNDMGKFVRITEVLFDDDARTGGRRLGRLYASMRFLSELLPALDEFLAMPTPLTGRDGRRRTREVRNYNRLYHLDLSENTRGIFLRISHWNRANGDRCTFILPPEAFHMFRQKLAEIISEFGEEQGPEQQMEEGPEHQEEGPAEEEATKRWYEWITARNYLDLYARTLIRKIGNGRDLGGKLTWAEKMGIKLAADEAIAWLDSNEDTSVEQMKDRLTELEALVKEATEEEYFSAEDMEGPAE